MRSPITYQIIFILTSINFRSIIGGESSHHFSPQFHHPPEHNVKEKGATEKRNSPHPRLCPVILRSPRVTNWGSWVDYFSTCPSETFVVGMQLKTDPFHGNHNNGGKADNTGLNGIKFFCGKLTDNAKRNATPQISRNITNQVQVWGKWGKVYTCRKGEFGIGFQLRVRKALPEGLGYGFKMDDVATCNLRLICSDGQVLEGDGRNEWGEWTKKRVCPKRHAFCTLKTQIESDQFIFDDTALNNIDVGCCPLRSGDQSTSVTGENFNTLKPNKVSSSDEKLMDGESLYNQDHRNFLDKAFDSVFDSAKIMQDVKKVYDHLIRLKSTTMNYLQL